MIWWAIEQRRKDREKLVKAVRAEERDRIRKHLERVAQEKGIPLERLLPEEAGRPCPTCGQPVMEEQAVS